MKGSKMRKCRGSGEQPRAITYYKGTFILECTKCVFTEERETVKSIGPGKYEPITEHEEDKGK